MELFVVFIQKLISFAIFGRRVLACFLTAFVTPLLPGHRRTGPGVFRPDSMIDFQLRLMFGAGSVDEGGARNKFVVLFAGSLALHLLICARVLVLVVFGGRAVDTIAPPLTGPQNFTLLLRILSSSFLSDDEELMACTID